METARGAFRKLGVASVLASSLLSLALLAQEPVPPKERDPNLEHGGGLYRLYCEVCHGSEGDNMNCMDIVPLAGLGRRPRVELVGRVLSPSYLFRGVSFEGADARDLSAYLLSLKGEKGFEDPGLRCPPRLLRKSYGLLDDYRVIDVREEAAYAKGHIPNAERWPAGEEGGVRTAGLVAKKLGLLAVRPAMSIVIYDETVTPAAAHLWWDLVRAGHQNVAVLDGGLRGYRDEGNATTVITPLVPVAYAFAEVAEVAAVRSGRDYPLLELRPGLPHPSPGVFDWERTVADGQLRTAAEIREYLARSEIGVSGAYRVEGSDAEASFLVYLLRLLGHNAAYYEPVGKLLFAGHLD